MNKTTRFIGQTITMPAWENCPPEQATVKRTGPRWLAVIPKGQQDCEENEIILHSTSLEPLVALP